jgi:DNA invertase Pin-like site-specific DNA recombinase
LTATWGIRGRYAESCVKSPKPRLRKRILHNNSDTAHSGASAVDREGFQQLVTEVSMGRAGVVLGLEVSRLARNSADWQRLLELCALTDTLILDEDGLYDCNDFNDRLLLGLKGTLSEAELHFLRARLRGGILSKARRGELASPLPIGFVYDENWRVRFDPDQQVQHSIRLLFETFRRTGAAYATMVYFQTEHLQFPRRLRTGVHKGELVWGELSTSRVLEMLHNPRYAGAFFFGRTRTRTWPDGKQHTQLLPAEDWLVLIPNVHVGYTRGKSTRITSAACANVRRPMAWIAGKAHPGKGQPCYRGWSSVAYAGTG